MGLESIVPGVARTQPGVRDRRGPSVPGRETGPHKSHSSNQRQPGSSGDFYGSSALERLQWKIGHSVGINANSLAEDKVRS